MGMEAHAFSSAQDVLSKSPAHPSRTWRAGRPPSAPSGCPSLWLLSLTTGILPFALRASMRCSPAFLTRAWARKRKWLGRPATESAAGNAW